MKISSDSDRKYGYPVGTFRRPISTTGNSHPGWMSEPGLRGIFRSLTPLGKSMVQRSSFKYESPPCPAANCRTALWCPNDGRAPVRPSTAQQTSTPPPNAFIHTPTADPLMAGSFVPSRKYPVLHQVLFSSCPKRPTPSLTDCDSNTGISRRSVFNNPSVRLRSITCGSVTVETSLVKN
jgi:hypothetical protein